MTFVSVVDVGLMAHLQHAADELLPEGLRVEVLDGMLVVNPPPFLPHARLTELLGALLRERLPEGLIVTVVGAGVYESGDPRAEYQQPDVTVYRDPGPDALRLTGADIELIGEVVSPANRRHRDYEGAVAERAVRYGIPWVLIADPETRTVRWWHDGAE
jgi:Uma2 family endonuclease